MDPAICNGKLLLAADDNWQAFAAAIPLAAGVKADTPPAYFDHFYWVNTIKKLVDFIK